MNSLEKSHFLITTTLQRIIFSTTKPNQHSKITTQVSKREFKLIQNFMHYQLQLWAFLVYQENRDLSLVQSNISFLGPSSMQISLYKHRVPL